MNKNKLIYLSHFINEQTPTYGNRNRFVNKLKSCITEGDTCNESEWNFTTNHIGTHVDFPNHFYENGDSLSDYNPKDFIFNNIYLIEVFCDKSKLIDSNDINVENIPKNTDFLIIKTNFEKFRNENKFWNDYPSFSSDLIKDLKDILNLKAIGFDLISLTSPNYKSHGKKSHQILLDNNIKKPTLIIEDMNLEDVSIDTKFNQLIMAPLLIDKANGCPVTIMADINI